MRVCMLAYTYYENDNRVRRYAEALAKRGDHVDVVALQSGRYADQEILRGVNVYRIQARALNERHKLHYLAKILLFLIRSAAFVTKRHLRIPYDLLHVHSVPDFVVLSALIPKLKGAKIILDIHDIVPEFYASKFKVSEDSVIFSALKMVEKLSIAFSDHVIIANHIWEQRLLSRSVEKEKCSVFLNYPDPAIFYPRDVEKHRSRLTFLYPGTLSWHQGLDVAIRAFCQIKDQLGTAEFHIYGDGPERRNLEKLVAELGIGERVLFKGLISMDEIGDVMARADIGVVPKKNDSFGGEAFSTKIFEFMALGTPVIVSATRIDTHYFKEDVVHFFEPDNADDLASAMLLLGKNEGRREALSRRALEFAAQYSWGLKRQEYYDLVDGLTDGCRTSKYSQCNSHRALLRTYYLFKPLLPRRIQIYARKRVALRKRSLRKAIWPIDEGTSKKPVYWPGWPQDKRFALVLTHDVEGKKGLARCRQLAKLEEMLGFRSSFNFVAEGYEVSQDLLNHLRKGGFEIGLHGITHRGNIFRSRKTFERRIDKINNYLKEWGAVGFRSPSMYHNLRWTEELAVDYDSSTFDVDPFEPQPDGVRTIYPFMVGKNGSQNSYVELPYTLPQDFLLYVVMREKTTSIWKEKLDWIADKGGMALLITHPDYMTFDAGKDADVDEYPVEFYAEFLEHVKARYEGQYWQALPREVAGFLRESEGASHVFAMQ